MPKETPDDPTTTNPESPQKEEQVPTEEQQFSPEAIEAIMAKVQDINREGTSFSALGLPTSEKVLTEVLSQGLLGTKNFPGEADKETWAQIVRQFRSATVWFNIVGKMKDSNTITGSMYLNGHTMSTSDYSHGKMAIIFDLGSRKIAPPVRDTNVIREVMGSSRTYSPSLSKKALEERVQNEELGSLSMDSSYGFALSYRVAPRLFRGIVVRSPIRLNSEEVDAVYKNRDRYVELPEHLKEWKELQYIKLGAHERDLESAFDKQRAVSSMISLSRDTPSTFLSRKELDEGTIREEVKYITTKEFEAYSGKPDLLIPIYHVNGDLLWPQRMSYNEVKKFVAEREAKKKSEADKKED